MTGNCAATLTTTPSLALPLKTAARRGRRLRAHWICAQTSWRDLPSLLRPAATSHPPAGAPPPVFALSFVRGMTHAHSSQLLQMHSGRLDKPSA